jgi:hypothetical protein
MTIQPRRIIAVSLLTALAFAACGRKSGDAPPGPVSAPVPAVADLESRQTEGKNMAGEQTTQTGVVTDGAYRFMSEDQKRGAEDDRKVIRTGRIELVVATYEDARAKIDALVQAAGGYVDSTQVNRRQDAISDATIVVRIPSTGFGDLLPKLREIGEIVSELTNAADITDQYVDIAARLASSKALEKRLLELATDRNGNIDSVLAVERELARVRSEIEGYEGHMRQWNDQIAMSALTLSLSTRRPEIVAAAAPSLGARTSQAFHASIAALRDFGGWLVINGIAFLPWLVLLIPGGLLLRRIARRVKLPFAIAKAKPAPVPPAPAPETPTA